MDAIQAFTGTDVEKAIVEPGAIATLAEYDTVVRHYDVIDEVLVSRNRVSMKIEVCVVIHIASEDRSPLGQLISRGLAHGCNASCQCRCNEP
jgi:hypothetical protein